MSGESPAVVLFGNVLATPTEMDVADGVAIPPNTNGIIFVGKDNTGKARFIAVDSTGKILASFTLTQPASGATTAVPQTVTNGTVLLAANAARIGATIYNNISNGFLYIKLGAGATPADWGVKIAPGYVYELPFPAYTGQITGVWSVAGGGTAQVTETS
jgi:hypothetical protein